jgi:hypothetical protein
MSECVFPERAQDAEAGRSVRPRQEVARPGESPSGLAPLSSSESAAAISLLALAPQAPSSGVPSPTQPGPSSGELADAAAASPPAGMSSSPCTRGAVLVYIWTLGSSPGPSGHACRLLDLTIQPKWLFAPRSQPATAAGGGDHRRCAKLRAGDAGGSSRPPRPGAPAARAGCGSGSSSSSSSGGGSSGSARRAATHGGQQCRERVRQRGACAREQQWQQREWCWGAGAAAWQWR